MKEVSMAQPHGGEDTKTGAIMVLVHWVNERRVRYRVTEFRGEEVFVSRKEWGIHLIPLVHVLRVLASPCVLRRMRITAHHCASHARRRRGSLVLGLWVVIMDEATGLNQQVCAS